jgi:hypothetical protein
MARLWSLDSSSDVCLEDEVRDDLREEQPYILNIMDDLRMLWLCGWEGEFRYPVLNDMND